MLIALVDDPVTEERGSESDIAGRNRGQTKSTLTIIFSQLKEQKAPCNLMEANGKDSRCFWKVKRTKDIHVQRWMAGSGACYPKFSR